jgi:hypothetical protein
MWWWRWTKKIIFTYPVRNEILNRVKERVCHSSCLLNHDIEGKTEGRLSGDKTRKNT